jgi:hypothetical protein
MSDFLKSLSARSFGLENESESVRPRQPSLFEKSRVGWGIPQDQAVTETVEETVPLQNESLPGSFEPHSSVAGHPAARLEESEPVTPLVTWSTEIDAKSSSHSASGLSPTPQQEPSLAKRQDRFAVPEAASRTQQQLASPTTQPTRHDTDLSGSERLPEIKSISIPGLKSAIPITTGPQSEHKTGESDAFLTKRSAQELSKLQSANFATDLSVSERPPEIISTNPRIKSSIPVTTGSQPDHKTTEPDVFPNKRSAQKVPQLQPVNLVADTSIFERMAMEKFSLHSPEVQAGINCKTSNALPKQKDSLPLPGQQFSGKWPSLQLAIHGLENHTASSGNEPEPTIQVTIGRIEIRATPAPQAVRKNTDKKPSTMSLEEYLDKRNGGAR